MTSQVRLLDLKVLYATHPCPASDRENLALVILGRLLNEGEPLDRSRWTFLFIGSIEDMQQQFTAYAGRQFDQRAWLSAEGRPCAAGEFLRRLNKVIDIGEQFGAQVLLKCGMRTLSWSEEEIAAGKIDTTPLTQYERLIGNPRYAVTIKTEREAWLVLETALRIKREARTIRKSRNQCGLPMIERLALNLNQQPTPTEFQNAS